MGICHHPNWIAFARSPSKSNDFPRVITYINICLSSLWFLLHKDIFNHQDINLISFSNNNIRHYILNVYSDLYHLALKYLKDTEVNINNVLIMTGDFNIWDSLWDPSFHFHSSISDNLIMIADSFDLALSSLTNPGPTRFLDTARESNSVIDLMFLRYSSVELDKHTILPDSRLFSDHTPLSIDIPIFEEIIQSSRFSITSKSNQEIGFIKDIISNFKSLDMADIDDSKKLEWLVYQLGLIVEQSWSKNTKKSRISKHSKQWWSESCSQALDTYRTTRSCENWKFFKVTVKNTKQSFFDDKIQEIANKSRGPWELMNWVKKRKLPATEAITHNDCPCLTPNCLWNALHSTFNTALHQHVNLSILKEIVHKSRQTWNSFSRYEFKSAISKCIDTPAPGPDKMTWCHWKLIIKDNECLSKIISIANACINLSHWPKYFKVSTTVVIPKPNKPSYDNLKAFQPIVLLNTLGKLVEKVIAERL